MAHDLFTPFGNGFAEPLDDIGRFHMRLSPEDMRKIQRGHQWKATVTDLNSGKKYLVSGASCSLPHCYCAAKIISVVVQKS